MAGGGSESGVMVNNDLVLAQLPELVRGIPTVWYLIPQPRRLKKAP